MNSTKSQMDCVNRSMDLVTILSKKVKAGDVMTFERKQILSTALNRMDPQKANTAFRLIRDYKTKHDTTRRVGDSDSPVPYYGEQIQAGIEFSTDALPDTLLLLLEQLLTQAN